MIFIIELIILLILDFQLGKLLIAKQNKSKTWLTNADQVTSFTAGDALFESMLTDMEKARNSIDLQFFIIRNDRIGNQFYSLLDKKQQEGVKVRVMTDWVGSFRFRGKWLKDKVLFRKSNPPIFPFFYHLQQRNHRKVLMIDEAISYVGGFNLGNEYVGKDNKLGMWRDYHLRFTGAITHVLKESFDIDWGEEIQRITVNDLKDAPDIRVLATEGNALEQEIITFISQSSKSIEIGSPYFVPTKKIDLALMDALQRGVKVTIVFPDKADHLLTKATALSYLKKMKKSGAAIYLYKDGFFHGKVLFFDESICDIGTANFDRRSLRLNQELNIIVTKGHPIFQEMKRVFRKDLSSCKIMTKGWLKHQPLYLKILMWLTIPFRAFL